MYHIILRENERKDIFIDEENKEKFIKTTTGKKIRFIKKEDNHFNWSNSRNNEKIVKRTLALKSNYGSIKIQSKSLDFFGRCLFWQKLLWN